MSSSSLNDGASGAALLGEWIVKLDGLYKEALEWMRREQQLLISGGADTLPEILEQKERVLRDISEAEAIRHGHAQSLFEEHGLAPDSVLSELLEALAPEERIPLEESCTRLGETLREIALVNTVNHDLTYQALNLIQMTFAQLVQESQPTYDSAQQEKRQALTRIIDRKA
jgi:antitoxin component of RelBE/YafQ-DinJ toxin-antitoxin module